MMFRKYLTADTYNEERTKSRIRKQRWRQGRSVGYYTEMFLRPDDPKLVNCILPSRMVKKDFASLNPDKNLIVWEEKLFGIRIKK